MESWFGSFKNERVHGERFGTRDEMKAMAFVIHRGVLQPQMAALDIRLLVARRVHARLDKQLIDGKIGSMKPTCWKTKNGGKVT